MFRHEFRNLGLFMLTGILASISAQGLPEGMSPGEQIPEIVERGKASELVHVSSSGNVLIFSESGLAITSGAHPLHLEFVDSREILPCARNAHDKTPEKTRKLAGFNEVVYEELWDGVSIAYKDIESGIFKSTYFIKSGGLGISESVQAIQIRYSRPVRIDKNGDLVMSYPTGEMRETCPMAWQEISGEKIPVKARFRLIGEREVGFEVGACDPGYPLVIDPLLRWNTFLGGAANDQGRAIAVDASGYLYVAGASSSSWGSPIRAYSGDWDVFVAKLDQSGALLWNTFLGSAAEDSGRGIVLDSDGNIYVSGYSYASWDTPIRSYTGGMDAFVAKLNSSGVLEWNTFLGASADDSCNDIAISADGGLYVAGGSGATWESPIQSHSGGIDAFFAKLSGNGLLLWNTFLGGSGGDTAAAVFSGADGAIFLAGTSAGAWGTPVRAFSGETDAFVARFDNNGTIQWNTFLGYLSDDYGYGIGTDSSGYVYVAGWSHSYGNIAWGEPIRPFTRNRDCFVAKLDGEGILQWNTFLGGEYFDEGHGLSVDAAGNAYVIGYSGGPWGSPIIAHAGGYDAFTAGVDTNGVLLWSTFLGRSGTLGEYGYGVSHDYRGNVFVTGYGGGTWGAPVRPFSGSYDAFVAKMGPDFSTVVIRSPMNGAAVGGIVPIEIDAYDQKGIQKVEVLIDGTLISTDTTYPYGYSWNTSGLLGAHTIKAVAYDPANLTAETQVTVNVVNELPPTITAHPLSRTIASGHTALLNVVASGTLPFSYQWYRGATGDVSDPVSGATSDTYMTPSLAAQASFWVQVSNVYGSASSDTAVLTIGETSTLMGAVFDGASRTGIAAAAVSLGESSPVLTDGSGRYEIADLSAGDYPIVITKDGYMTFTDTVGIPVAGRITRNFFLAPSGSGPVTIDSLTCKYSGFIYFLTGVDFVVNFSAHVNWGGHAPGSVRFITSNGQYNVAASGDVVSREFNVAQEFVSCSTLKAVAISADGSQSQIAKAEFTVMPMPLADLLFEKIDRGDSFYYQLRKTELEFINEHFGDDVIPEDIPFFGSRGFNLDTLLSVNATANSSGQVDFDLNLTEDPIFQDRWSIGRMAGFDFTLTPELRLSAHYSHPECRYIWDGSYLALHGNLSIQKSWPFPSPVLGWLVPMYAKASFSLGVDATLGIENLSPVSLSGQVDIEPTLRGTLGAGIDRFVGAELWIQGSAAFNLQYPAIPHLSNATVNITAGTTGHAFGFRLWNRELLSWDWSLIGGDVGPTSSYQSGITTSQPVARDYLGAPSAGLFFSKPDRIANAAYTGLSRVSVGLLQDTVYPYSDPSLSHGGGPLGMTWVQDAPERIDVNRTVITSTFYDGASWSAPSRIGDDGTADFHPQLIMFDGGDAIAVWEDQKVIHPEMATLEDLITNFEISAAVYQSATATWQPFVRLTDNDYLEGSPLISGPSPVNVMATWIANEGNDLRGSPALPNKIRYSLYNGTSWSAAQLAAQVNFGILKYNLIFNGITGYLVISVDADNDPATVSDNELYRVTYSGGEWGSLTRLTQDSLPDVNPKLAYDPAGRAVLVWMKGNDLVCSVDFGAPSVIYTEEFSSNLADFELAASGGGRLAILWIDPEEYSSDLKILFYDPAYQTWGASPQQITFDPEIERNVAISFYGSNSIVAAYDRTPVETTTSTRVTADGDTIILDIPQPGITDLYVLEYQMGKDLGLSPMSLRASPPNPEPGAGVTLTVTVANTGDETALGVPIAFYHGDPSSGGILIGQAVTPAIFRPGDTAGLSCEWEIPETSVPLRIYAVADPEGSYDPAFPGNNTIDIEIVKPDLTVNGVNWEWLGADKVLITARILNAGVIPSLATTLKFRRDSSSGELISDQALPALAKGEFRDVTIEWDLTGLSLIQYPVHLTVDEENFVAEYDEVNNWRLATVIPEAIVDSIIIMSPIGGESWAGRSSHDIRWATAGLVGDVRVECSTDGGNSFSQIIGATPNDGSYTWVVANLQSTTCLVRVSDADGIPVDLSDAYFTILAVPEIIVTSPNGGERWLAGSTHEVAWAQTAIAGLVMIDLYRGGVFEKALGTADASSGAFSCVLSSDVLPGAGYRIRVYQGDIWDESDSDFSIVSSTRVDFNSDGQEDILWRYYGEGAYQGLNVAWLMNQTGAPPPAPLKADLDTVRGRSLLSGAPSGVIYQAQQHSKGLAPAIATPGAFKTVLNGEKALALKAERIMRDPMDYERGRSRSEPERDRGKNKTGSLVRNDAADVSALSGEEVKIASLQLATEVVFSQIADTSWEIAGTGDFNGDGKTDILWRYYGAGDYQGLNDIWFMDGTTFVSEAVFSQVPDTNWRIAGTGDFNGDGETDLLWRYYGTGAYQGLNVIWFMNDASFIGEAVFSQVLDTDWRIEGTGDFNADGETDILWRYYGTGAYQGLNDIWFMNDSAFLGEAVFSQILDTGWEIGGTGDFNNDGQTDILWRYYGAGAYQGLNDIWYMNGTAFVSEEVFSQVPDTNWRTVNR